MLTEKTRGEQFCQKCGSYIKWARLDSGRWIAIEPEPTIYRDGGKRWLVTGSRWSAQISKNCSVWRPGQPTEETRKGHEIHAFKCSE